MSASRIAKDALLTAIALIAFMIENLFPPLLAFAPGVKIGISNAVTLIALVLIGAPDAFVILLLRCLLGALASGNLFSLAYSLPAGVLSLAVQTALYSTLAPKLSLTGISLFGATVHNLTQLAVASAVVGANLLGLLPLMLAASAVAGAAVGIIAYLAVKFLPPSLYETDKRRKQEGGPLK